LIEFNNAGFSYGTSEIFSGVSLALSPGSFHFLTGPSGAGKTTLLKLCTVDLLPTLGTMNVFGEDVSGLDRDEIAAVRRRIGVVHQNCQFVDHLSVRQNVALPLVICGQDTSQRQAEIEDLLNWVGLLDRAEAAPPELSGGERQRAALAQPTGNIDWEMGQKVMTLLMELNKLGKTILIASHDLTMIRAVGHQIPARVLRLKSGRLVQAGANL